MELPRGHRNDDLSFPSRGDHAWIGTFGDREQSLSPIAPPANRNINYANAVLDPSERRNEHSFMLSQASFTQRIEASFAQSNVSNASFYPTEDLREERLRLLLYEAQQYDLKQTAMFLAEKLVALTGKEKSQSCEFVSPQTGTELDMLSIDGFIEDVYNLAQTYYRSQQYNRALALLNTKSTINRSVQCRYLAGLCAVRYLHEQFDIG